MQEFYDAEKRALERQRERMLKQYPLIEALSDFSRYANQLSLRYVDFIDNPNPTQLRIMRILLTNLTNLWLQICEANLLQGDSDDGA